MFAMLAALLASQPCSAQSWETLARTALIDALRAAHPEVQEWALEARVSERQRRMLEIEPPDRADVRHMGARSAVRLEWSASDRGQGVATVWFAVSGIAPLVQAKDDVRAYAPVEGSDFELMPRDVMAVACRALIDTAGLDGMRATRRIGAQEVVCQESIEPRPLVSRGQQVKVISTSGLVTVMTTGVAEEDGELGEVLRIRNPASRSSYQAAVTGDNEVSIHE
jgi:flagella basal body P-ring formation protein FlgA